VFFDLPNFFGTPLPAMTNQLKSTQLQTTLAESLTCNAATHGDDVGFTFLADGEGDARPMTWEELHQRALAIAGILLERGAEGDRVLLLEDVGLDYVAALFGTMYAGMVVVPAYPLDPRHREGSLQRVHAIIDRAQASLAITSRETRASIAGDSSAAAAALQGLVWLTGEDFATAAALERPLDRASDPDALALLQFTSGSTGAPRGVMLSHGNLAANVAIFAEGFESTADSVSVSWLPLFHDLGLISTVCHTVALRCHSVFMHPYAFLLRPIRWLEAISTYRGTHSCAPNFAFDYTARRITLDERSHLDLSSWQIAGSGGEPVRATTVERFARTLGPAGASPEALRPGWGLAEGTCLLVGTTRGGAVVRDFELAALQEGRVVEWAGPDAGERVSLVAAGTPMSGTELAIADPESCRRCPEDRVGEIWARSPSVGGGYWGEPERTAETFAARLEEEDDRPWMRTGDLGFVREENLFVVSRLKDLIIIRGRNHAPQEIEQTVEESHPALRRGCGAAFSIEVGDEERLVVAQEVRARVPAKPEELARAIAAAVAERHGIDLHSVALLPPQTVPKTSSGKIQRAGCRASFAEWSELGYAIAPR
jgi:acyl-CoA synthetase (AMP-forming)/AMP-acid ligase II